jgi:hypothetical protein
LLVSADLPVLFLVSRNQKDEKELERQLNKDFGIPKKIKDSEDAPA